jgi:hypothetical protein
MLVRRSIGTSQVKDTLVCKGKKESVVIKNLHTGGRISNSITENKAVLFVLCIRNKYTFSLLTLFIGTKTFIAKSLTWAKIQTNLIIIKMMDMKIMISHFFFLSKNNPIHT